MNKFNQLQKVKELFAIDGNILQYIKNIHKSNQNTIE